MIFLFLYTPIIIILSGRRRCVIGSVIQLKKPLLPHVSRRPASIYTLYVYICRYTGHASALQPPVRRSIRRNYTLMSTLNYRRRALYRIYGGYRRWRRGERNENKYHPLELGEGKRVIAMNFNQSGQRALI